MVVWGICLVPLKIFRKFRTGARESNIKVALTYVGVCGDAPTSTPEFGELIESLIGYSVREKDTSCGRPTCTAAKHRPIQRSCSVRSIHREKHEQ